ncbi:undecaprenyl-diphosphatase 2 [Sphaerisporangium krabiense]|uniref:Undecaprenyl-diphosphatase n=1 Tax=Sphaerisporangium krabiense TaxID=763782 RepID=A0A7W9DV57_9ACTN|nr:undecaprenyl-diphosphate phosphatase [Sphaerisporangium krabiense]MBB5631105.1 undecaprenyl-diphosphatase [Sphaerisporangium krabiense]GII65991.1 undecaprenyl-diphosphatase 2 [Sphaerisporangium krabiense]
MDALQAIVLGVVQGLTEFLPISSSAHLLIVPRLFGWSDPGAAFTAVIQLGTMLAVVIYFWRDITRILWTWLRSLWTPELRGEMDARMGWYIGLGTIPLGLLGVVFKDAIEGPARNLWLNATVLIVFGLLLLLAEQVGRQRTAIESLTLRDGLIIGGFQALALMPGASRSGSTITGGLFLGFTREAAARYSFLLSIPAVVLSGLFEMRDIGAGGGPDPVPTLIATVVSFAVGYASIAWLLRYITRHSMMIFVTYRVFIGAFLLTLLSLGVITAQ